MKKLTVPSLLVAIVATQTGCPVCEYPLGPAEPNPNQSRRIAEGAWMLEVGQINRDGRCGDIDADELRRLHAFVEHRGDRGLFIDIEGLVTRGEQHGPEVLTYGVLEEDIAIEAEPPHSSEEEDTEADTGEDEEGRSDAGIAPPPCEEDREEREDEREDERERPREEPPYYGVAVTLSALADGSRWMDGDLFIDLYEGGDVTCTISARISGYADDDIAYEADYADTVDRD